MFKITKTTKTTVSVTEMFGIFDGRDQVAELDGELYTTKKEAEKVCKNILADESEYDDDATSENIFVVRITKV